MPATLLTDTAIRKMKPTAGRQVDVYDSNVRGLVLRVSPNGTKTFVVWYRIGGKARRLTLGRFPILQLADARQRAKAALVQVADGRDPAAERQRAREEYGDKLFGPLSREYIERYAKHACPLSSGAIACDRRANQECWP
jgi:Arm DNA-binding domain